MESSSIESLLRQLVQRTAYCQDRRMKEDNDTKKDLYSSLRVLEDEYGATLQNLGQRRVSLKRRAEQLAKETLDTYSVISEICDLENKVIDDKTLARDDMFQSHDDVMRERNKKRALEDEEYRDQIQIAIEKELEPPRKRCRPEGNRSERAEIEDNVSSASGTRDKDLP